MNKVPRITENTFVEATGWREREREKERRDGNPIILERAIIDKQLIKCCAVNKEVISIKIESPCSLVASVIDY